MCVGTALLGMFFFLTLFIQDVWGYSALKTGLAYLPIVPAILAVTVGSSLVNVGQQVGSSIGLAVLGTVAWSAVASSLRSQYAAATGQAIIALAVIRVRRQDLSGADPATEPPGDVTAPSRA